METEKLLNRIAELENENKYLKSLLDEAGIKYAQMEREIIDDKVEQSCFDANQGERIIPFEINRNVARQFYSYFWGRTDVYSKRYQNKNTGKAGYYTQCNNFWKRGICPRVTGNKIKCKDCNNRQWTRLDVEQIEKHLRGEKVDASDVIGIYPLLSDGTCRFLVFDFDNHEKYTDDYDGPNADDAWINEVNALREIGKENEVPMLAERSRSGKGAHVWIFFDAPISAASARKFGFSLLDKGAESINMKSFRFYDRMLPAQDSISEGELGNLIALPLQGKALKNGNSAFVDEKFNAYEDQWKALLNTQKISAKRIEAWNKKQESNQSDKPWERLQSFNSTDVAGKLKITTSNLLFIDTSNLKPRIQNQIRRLAAISNPAFFRNKAMGISNFANSRFIYLGEDDGGYICIPRGLQEKLIEKCGDAGIGYEINDRRCAGSKINVNFTGELRDSQKKAASKILLYDNGILSAATAFGKTVVCSYIIAQKKTNTLILLESSTLIEQWEKSLSEFLDIDEALPEYKTKTGRIKVREKLIGIIHGVKDTSTGIIDIAMAGSLYKKGELHPRLKEYGLVIVDECHHCAPDTISRILREIPAKYVYGVTATPFRGDGLEKINEMYLGPIRFEYSAKEKAKEQGIDHFIIPRFTRVVCPHGKGKADINEAYKIIRTNEQRNEQIAEDVKKCISEHRTPVVLTKFIEHADVLYEMLRDSADKVFLMTGNKSKKKQRQLREEMDAVSEEETMVLIATGQLVGEGFDYPRLDTLIMADPVKWKGIVEQYAGRLNRDFPGKRDVRIYDYIDANIYMFDNMYAARMKAYKRIGYNIYSEEQSDKQEVNAIYDSESYLSVYEQDLLQATKDIIISSPTLGKDKVERIIRMLRGRQEAGVKVTIVTWHPDVYKYGKDENRIMLMENLRNAGFNIELVEENCEHYAVIDNEIVWYGSMNLLSKDDVSDNIMRVADKKIAQELLEMTFGKGSELREYRLPIE